MTSRDRSTSVAAVAIAGLFVTALVTAQLTASKVLEFGMPFSVPVVGDSLVLPGASLAIAVMFFASDVYTELYGKRSAQVLVNVGFGLNFVLLALVWSTILAPAAPTGVDPATYETVLGASTNIVIGSLLAYLVSQNWDVMVFHAIREFTDGAHLWLRNIGSTATSQALDTVIFVTVGFYLAPTLLGIGTPIPVEVLVPLVAGQYLLKLAIAIVDTPFVYLLVGIVRRRERPEPVVASAD